MKRLVLIALAALVSTGVAAKKEKPKPPVAEVPNYVLAAPPAEQAQIVFLEPINKIQGMFPICILDVTGDQKKNNWQAKTAAEAAELTLTPEDAVAP